MKILILILLVFFPTLSFSQSSNSSVNNSKIVDSAVAIVTAVNSLGGFIIINIGDEAGVKLGDVFNIFRNNKLVATIEVIQTRAKISACDLKKEIEAVAVGDIVKRP